MQLIPRKQNIVSSSCFDSHWQKNLKNIVENVLTSLACLAGECGWMALITSFGMARAHTIFSAKYNLKIYTENSFQLMH